MFFNTEPNIGGVIHGSVIALEEQRANGADIDDEAINSVKSGLMGPLAGIGDTISQGTITPILLALGIGLAGRLDRGLGGGPGRHQCPGQPARRDRLPRPRGRDHPLDRVRRLHAGLLPRPDVRDRHPPLGRHGPDHHRARACSGTSSSAPSRRSSSRIYIAVPIRVGATNINIQTDILDRIFPGLLGLGLVLLTWWLLRRGISPVTLLIAYLVIAIVGSIPFFGSGAILRDRPVRLGDLPAVRALRAATG